MNHGYRQALTQQNDLIHERVETIQTQLNQSTDHAEITLKALQDEIDSIYDEFQHLQSTVTAHGDVNQVINSIILYHYFTAGNSTPSESTR